ncbi:MAG: Crp/Fnr family transcriptional regulator [Leptolyngbyaceae cyanobacterium]
MLAKPSVLPLRPASAHQSFIDALEQLYRERTLIAYKAGQTISLQQGALLVVCRGIVQLSTIQPDGCETLLGLAGPSTPIGLPLTIINPYWATALTDVDVLPLAMAEIEASPVLMAGLGHNLVGRLQQTEAWLAISGKRLVVDRLHHLLVLLAQELGQVEPSGVRIPVRLTHHQLATAIGTTRVTVTRLLKDFKTQGWLKTHHRYFIVNWEQLNIASTSESSLF